MKSHWLLFIATCLALTSFSLFAEAPKMVSPSSRELAPLIQGKTPSPKPESYRRPLRAGEYDWKIIGLHPDFEPVAHAMPACRKVDNIIYLRGIARVKDGPVTTARPLGHLPPSCRGNIDSYGGTFYQGPLRIIINSHQGVLNVRAWDWNTLDEHRATVVFDGIYFFAD